MVRFFRDAQTKEFLIAGTGQQHIEVIVSKLKKRYHTEVLLKAPKVPYRETIRGTRRRAGSPQEAERRPRPVWRLQDQDGTAGRAARISSSSMTSSAAPFPRTTFPPSKRALWKQPHVAILAGFPVVDFRVILYDGSYHDVDSNELSFKTAGRIAFKKAMEQAKPTLLEPIMNVEITIPDEFAGGIMGDLKSVADAFRAWRTRAARQS